MRCSTWNVRTLYRAGLLMTAYKSELVEVFVYGTGNENHKLGSGFFVHKRDEVVRV
jgi:hypothetical protein